MKIAHLTIYTAHLQQQREFYTRILGLGVLEESRENVSFKIGTTVLQLQRKEKVAPYHFAINIPSDAAIKALAWLKERVTILPFEGSDLVDFKNWNAESVYFYDADKNIVELIARKNLKIESSGNFSAAQFLSISEIGVAVDDIEKTYLRLDKMKKLPIYDGDFGVFCAAGDEEGLFILVNRNKKKWFPTNEPVQCAGFIIKGDYNFEFRDKDVAMMEKLLLWIAGAGAEVISA